MGTKRYYAYIRVSTPKQGEKGSSLLEQKAAIEAYARRHNLLVAEWFEEKETAAKQGRPIFTRMLKALDRGLAAGVITHKIDRSARNLRDWATLGELPDRGIELHFAHESIDLSSRGGRLSADIQAVVAADFIRNLREETRKGFYGRLKQGLYPIRAPIGYLDQGGGKPKTIDPVKGPVIARAFELYATGKWSFETIGAELYARGLRGHTGGRVTRNGLSTILNNTFYFGVIRIGKTGETFQGVHEPLITKKLFDEVQDVLHGRVSHRTRRPHLRYQRVLRCATCEYSLIGDRQKGFVYYRCHTTSCPTTCLREESISETLYSASAHFHLTDDEWATIECDIDKIFAHRKENIATDIQAATLSIGALDERIARLTDAYVDQLVDRETYMTRKGQLLGQRATVVTHRKDLEYGGEGYRQRMKKILELIKALGNIPIIASDDELRDLLKETTSNIAATGKNVAVSWANPFSQLITALAVPLGDPERIKPRTAAVLEIVQGELREANTELAGRQSLRHVS